MKLRFLGNSVRLRVNQREVDALASGETLQEDVCFPGGERLAYRLQPASQPEAQAEFDGQSIQIAVPATTLYDWAAREALGLYFEFPTSGGRLKVSLEKDLECLHGPEDERDPEAFPRK